MAGQIGDPHPRQKQETAAVDQPGKIRPAGCRCGVSIR
jgi:hypothetical protein